MKVSIEDRGQIIEALRSGTATLQELGDKYGVTRECIRQYGAKAGINGPLRVRLRSIECGFNIQRGVYPEYVAAVWNEAVEHGFTVRAWRYHNKHFYKHALFINARRCWISHATNSWKPNGQRLYAHVRYKRLQGTRICVLDIPQYERAFYIFPRWINFPNSIYIPLNDSLRPKLTGFDYSPYKNAWHLLKTEGN